MNQFFISLSLKWYPNSILHLLVQVVIQVQSLLARCQVKQTEATYDKG